jgi:hypothetical protein
MRGAGPPSCARAKAVSARHNMRQERTFMRVTITLELSKQAEHSLLQNSIERVMNNAIYVGRKAERSWRQDETSAERASILHQDCEELKPLVCALWNAARESLMDEEGN